MESKKCTKCNTVKSLSEFNKDKTHKDGFRSLCKTCSKIWRDNNRPLVNKLKKESYDRIGHKTAKIYRQVHKKEINEYQRTPKRRKYSLDWQHKNKDKLKEYRERPKSKLLVKKRSLKYYHAHKDDPKYKMKWILHNMTHCSITKGINSPRTQELLGCDTPSYLKHMESQFYPHPITGVMMSWENHGKGDDKWNVDHIIPRSKFDMTNPEHQKICFNYKNQRPLWQIENHAKSDKILPEFQELYEGLKLSGLAI